MKQVEIKIKFFLYVFLIIFSTQTCNAIEKNKSAAVQIQKFFENRELRAALLRKYSMWCFDVGYKDDPTSSSLTINFPPPFFFDHTV